METQTNLDVGIGNTEVSSLAPKLVKIESVEIRPVEIKGKKNEKLVCRAKHPDREEPIEISQVKTERKGKLEVTGLWIAKDKDGKLIKNSALAVLLNTLGCKTPKELVGKEVPTILDEKGYLAIKGY